MGNSTTSSSLLRRALAWLIIAAVAVLAFKLVVGLVVGFVHFLFVIALVGVAITAVVWAMRHL